MTVRLLGPNGSSGVNLNNPNNIEKTIDAGDLASDSFFKGRVGDSGSLSFRNKVIDGRFDFWYEGATQTANGYGSATMWQGGHAGSSKTVTRGTLTTGVDLPCIEVPSAKYFYRTTVTSVTGSNNYVGLTNKIESVLTLAGKQCVVSFYAKGDSNKPMGVNLSQIFGTSGSTINQIPMQVVNLTTEWTKYELVFDVPSVTGKTIDTTDDRLNLNFWFDIGASAWSGVGSGVMIQQSGVFDIACVQLEEGSVATQFEELPIEIATDRVNRYYEIGATSTIRLMYMTNPAGAQRRLHVRFRVDKRASPTVTAVFSTNSTYSLSPFVQGRTASEFSVVGELSVTTGAVYISLESWIADARL